MTANIGIDHPAATRYGAATIWLPKKTISTTPIRKMAVASAASAAQGGARRARSTNGFSVDTEAEA
jgi:hypothetical protein